MTGHKQDKWLRPRARSPHTAPGCMRLGCRVGILQLAGLGSTDKGLRQASGLRSIPRLHWPDLPPAKDPGGSSRTSHVGLFCAATLSPIGGAMALKCFASES